MTITLPETVRAWIETQAGIAGLTVDQYVLTLVHQAHANQGDIGRVKGGVTGTRTFTVR